MKGIVFTEFLELVENKFGLNVLDQVIEVSNTKDQGIYTAVGTYDHEDLISMVTILSETTGLSLSTLLVTYGEHMFEFFTKRYVDLFIGIDNPIDFLSKVDSYIHVEVEKLYPDAELPRFVIVNKTKTSITLIYESHRRMSDFAVGLIKGCGKYFGTEMHIKKTDLLNGDGAKVKFDISTI